MTLGDPAPVAEIRGRRRWSERWVIRSDEPGLSRWCDSPAMLCGDAEYMALIKLGVGDRAAAVRVAYDRGLL